MKPDDVGPVVDPIAHLDFEVVLMCETDGCHSRALWLGRWPCCGLGALFCGMHRSAMELGFATADRARRTFQHKVCNGSPVRFLRWTPLGVSRG